MSYLPNHGSGLLRTYVFAFATRPLATTIATAMVPIGAATIVLGDQASRAFTLIPGGSLIAHILGGLLALGGAATVSGTLRLGSFTELLGQVFVAAGTFLYACGVLLGLGWNGFITGGVFLAITIGTVGRVVVLASLAHKRDRA